MSELRNLERERQRVIEDVDWRMTVSDDRVSLPAALLMINERYREEERMINRQYGYCNVKAKRRLGLAFIAKRKAELMREFATKRDVLKGRLKERLVSKINAL